jgi:hypothetical protein
MSGSYKANNAIVADRLFDGCLQEFAIHEHINSDASSPEWRCLTDGRNCLWVSIEDGVVCSFNGYMLNDPTKILNAVAFVFGVEIFSEYEPQFWGFETDEDWEAAEETMRSEIEIEKRTSLQNLGKFLGGEPHCLTV